MARCLFIVVAQIMLGLLCLRTARAAAAAPNSDDFLRDARSSMKSEGEYVKFVLNLIQNNEAKAPLRLAALKAARRLQTEPSEADGTGRMPVLQARTDEIGGVVKTVLMKWETPAELVPAALEIVIHDLRTDLGSLADVARAIRAAGGDSSFVGRTLSAEKAKIAEEALAGCSMKNVPGLALPQTLSHSAWLDLKLPESVNGKFAGNLTTAARRASWLNALSSKPVCAAPRQPSWCNPGAWAVAPLQNAAHNWTQTRTQLQNLDPAEMDF